MVEAVLQRRRRMREPPPGGAIGKVACTATPAARTRIKLTGDHGADCSMTLGDTEVAAAVAYRLGRHIPLPADSGKTFYLINGSLTPMITMNFHEPLRLVETAKGAGRRPDLRPTQAP